MACNESTNHCQEFLAQAALLLDGELDQADAALLERHFEECSPCMEQHEIDALVKALVKRGCGCEPAPSNLRSRIKDQLTRLCDEQSAPSARDAAASAPKLCSCGCGCAPETGCAGR